MNVKFWKFSQSCRKWFVSAVLGLSMVAPAFALTKTEPDIVVPNFNDNSLSVVVNVAGKEFVRLPSDMPAGDAPVFVASGDFNEDRLKDLAIVNVNGQLTFMLGQGNGNFATVPVQYDLGYALSDTLAVGDFNNDGHDDILVSSQGSTVQILLGDGQLADNPQTHFTPQNPAFVGNRANAVAVADFNEDGKLDAVVCDYNGSSAKVLLGDGQGGLGSPLSLNTGSAPSEVAIADFNDDGNADFAVGGGTSQYVSVYLGKGDGTFNSEIQVTTRNGGDGTFTVAVGDFNNDGYDDFVTRGGTPPPGDTIVVRLWNPASNNFVVGGSVSANGAWLSGLSVADFNGDGNQDIVLTNAPVDNNLSIYYGDGTGNWGSLKNVAVGNLPNAVAVLDVNPIIGDYTTTVRISNKLEGSGDVRTFSTADKLYVILEDVKLNKDVVPEIATIKLGQAEAPFVVSRDGVFTAMIELDSFPLGDQDLTINFKASILNTQNNTTTQVSYRRSTQITLVADSLRQGLITYYPLNAAPKNDRVQDISIIGNDGIVNGAIFTANGRKGGAYSFDGLNDTIYGKKGLGTLPTGSLSFWMKSDAVENFRSPFSGLQPAACGNVCTRFEQNNAGQMIVGPLQFQSPGVYSPIQQDQWHHVALVWSTTQATGYLDGVQQFTVNINPSNLSFTPVLGAGSFFGGNGPVYFKGLIDELRMYNRTLSPAEVLKLYNI